MPNPLLVRRVEILEENVDAFSQLPERVRAVESQLVSLRDDFTSLRDDVTSLRDDVTSLRDDFTSFRAEVRAEFVAVRTEFVAVRAEIRTGDDETRREMRVLHEDVISRIALLQEGIDRRNGRDGHSARTRTSPKRRR